MSSCESLKNSKCFSCLLTECEGENIKNFYKVFFLIWSSHLVMTFKTIVSLGLAYFPKCHLLVKKKWGLQFEKVKKLWPFQNSFEKKNLSKKFVLWIAECSCYNKTTPLCRPCAHIKNFVAWFSIKTNCWLFHLFYTCL